MALVWRGRAYFGRAPGRRRVLLGLVALIGVALSAYGVVVLASPAPLALAQTVAPVDPAEPGTDADFVIIAGAAGLRWDDIDQSRTPALWRLAEHASIGSLATRSATVPTCPGDGWLTLGAGNYAVRGETEVELVCPPLQVPITEPAEPGGSATVDDQEDIVELQREQPFGAVPGALAESVRCTTAVGQGAAVAAARPFGRVDHYAPTLPADPAGLLSVCILSIVDLGTVSATTPAERAAEVALVDAALAKVLAARPDRSTVMVAGVSDTERPSRLHVAIIDGPGWVDGWLTSATTGRQGYLALIDIAASALEILDRSSPGKGLIAGHPAVPAPGRPDLGDVTAAGSDADLQAASSRTVSAWFFGVLTGLQILLYLAVVPLLRRSYRHAGPLGPTSPPRVLVVALEVLLIAVSLAVPAALMADLVPWWRTSSRGLVFSLVTLGLIAVLTVVAIKLPISRRHTLGPVGVVSAIAAGVVGLDLLTGARLQLNGVAGYSALEGGRYAGLGIVGMGVFIAGTLLTSGCLAQLIPVRRQPDRRPARRRAQRAVRQARYHGRVLLISVLGAIAVLLVGSPFLGADAGGAVAMTAGVCLTAAMCTGGWLTFSRIAWATLGGLAVTLLFALIDVRRPPTDQGSLGRFLNQLADGTSSLTLHRTGVSNMVSFASSPLTVLAIASAIFVWSVLLRPWGGLKRLFGIYPALKAAVAGAALAAVIAGLLGGAALNVVGTAAATALPLLTLGALRVLEHAADRTRAVEEAAQSQSDDAAALVEATIGRRRDAGGADGADVPEQGDTPEDFDSDIDGDARPAVRPDVAHDTRHEVSPPMPQPNPAQVLG
jgi:hypothetical protein